jgi:hypothetical protein
MPTEDTIVSTLLDNEEYIEVLESGLEIEKDGGTGSPWKSGWDYSDVAANPQNLSQMVQDGLLDVTRRSSRPNTYSLKNADQVEQALELVQEGGSVGESDEPETVEDTDGDEDDIPDDLFDVVIGHEPVKDLLNRCINTDEQTHFRLQGESSTAKSVFLTELERVEGAVYRSASGMTEAGLLDILIEDQPEYLLFDEIDKAEKECYTPLYELTEHGRIQKTISGSSMNIELNCNLVVTLNHPDKLPEELRKRMIELKFEEYSDGEYVEIVTRVLCNKFELDEDIASFIAEYQLEELGEKNVREPEQIAKLSKNDMDDVKRVIENIEDYR